MTYAVYFTDNQHTFQSRELIGVVTNLDPVGFIISHALKNESFISMDDINNLKNIKQTQNYEDDGEYVYEAIAVNEPI